MEEDFGRKVGQLITSRALNWRTGLNSKLILISKILVTVFFIGWLIRNRSYNLQNIEVGLSNYKLALCFLGLTFVQLFLFSLRMKLLLHAKATEGISLKDMILISWASNFVNCIAPSSLFGDLFRIKKLTSLDSNQPADATVYASIFSKIFSTFGLISITTVASLMALQQFKNLQELLYWTYYCFGFLILLFFFRAYVLKTLGPYYQKGYKLHSSSFFHNRLDNFKKYAVTLSRTKSLIIQTYVLSLGIQLLNTLSFVLIIYTLNPDSSVSIVDLICIVPVGILIMTLPISFSGLGIGHVAFSQLLKPLGINNGSDIFSVFFAFSYLFNLLGVIPFFKLMKKS
jgi:uncharacterized membrane protein YbhN (UPF0104 family)